MNPSPLFFLPESEYVESGLRSEELQGAHEVGGRAQGDRRAPTLVDRVWAPGLDLLLVFFIISKKTLRGVSGHSENFCFCT